MQASPELELQLLELGLQPLAHRLTDNGEHPIAPLLPADVREAEEVERLGLALASIASILGREGTELEQAGLGSV